MRGVNFVTCSHLDLLHRSTDSLSRCGAPVKNLAHSESVAAGENNAPSNPGIKHLARAKIALGGRLMAVAKPLSPGKSVRFWTRLEHLPEMFFGPVPREIGLCWFSYDKDGSVYTGASFSGDMIDSPSGSLAGAELKLQKISIHGSGKILGPDRRELSAVRPEDHLGFSIRNITGRAKICAHGVSNGGNYVSLFNAKEHARITDVFIKEALERHGRFVITIEIAPEGTNITADQEAWITKPLDNGTLLLIIANVRFYEGENRPDGHFVLVPRG